MFHVYLKYFTRCETNKIVRFPGCGAFDSVPLVVVSRSLAYCFLPTSLFTCTSRYQSSLFSLSPVEGRVLKADLHGTTLTHTTSLQQAYDMTWDLHDSFIFLSILVPSRLQFENCAVKLQM